MTKMKKLNITGRDSYIVAQALAYASEWMKSLDLPHDEPSNRYDMDDLLEHAAPGMATMLRWQAQNKLQNREFSSTEEMEQSLRDAGFRVLTHDDREFA